MVGCYNAIPHLLPLAGCFCLDCEVSFDHFALTVPAGLHQMSTIVPQAQGMQNAEWLKQEIAKVKKDKDIRLERKGRRVT